MKRLLFLSLFCFLLKSNYAQDAKTQIERACLDYLEGFYEGDTSKLIRSLKPTLYKFGYWKNKTSANYEPDGNMTFQQAIDYAKKVFEKKHFAKAGSPKKVEIFDIMKTTASAKVTAWWGYDYILLAKQNDKWMIEQVLWEGPLEK
jgi:hypothetical protein